MNLDPNKAVGLIPARGGSKSVKLKNLFPLAGRPLLDYCIQAAKPAGLSEIVCSTDHDEIEAFSLSQGISVQRRPDEFSTDQSPVIDTIRYFLQTFPWKDGKTPGIVVLLQPTSPFLLPEHISNSVKYLIENPEKDAVQTVVPVPHNFHAYNQRSFAEGRVKFFFEDERKRCYNKQTKPSLFKFGNLLTFRSQPVLDGGDFFGRNCGGLEISDEFALDVDSPRDFLLAEMFLEKGFVSLPFVLNRSY